MAAPVGPFRFHPAAQFVPGGVQTIPLTLGADVDLTAPAGPTAGYCARAILVGSTAGNLTYYDMTGAGPFTVPLAANQLFQQSVSLVVNATTTAAIVCAVL